MVSGRQSSRNKVCEGDAVGASVGSPEPHQGRSLDFTDRLSQFGGRMLCCITLLQYANVITRPAATAQKGPRFP